MHSGVCSEWRLQISISYNHSFSDSSLEIIHFTGMPESTFTHSGEDAGQLMRDNKEDQEMINNSVSRTTFE